MNKLAFILASVIVIGDTILEVKKEIDIRNGKFDKDKPYLFFPFIKSWLKKLFQKDSSDENINE